jgi:hypothetical protein
MDYHNWRYGAGSAIKAQLLITLGFSRRRVKFNPSSGFAAGGLPEQEIAFQPTAALYPFL